MRSTTEDESRWEVMVGIDKTVYDAALWMEIDLMWKTASMYINEGDQRNEFPSSQDVKCPFLGFPGVSGQLTTITNHQHIHPSLTHSLTYSNRPFQRTRSQTHHSTG